MPIAREKRSLPDVAPDDAYRLWVDIDRWPTFIEGFAHALERPQSWPEEGSKIVWRSIPGGRGQVTERVLESQPGRAVVTQVYEEALTGRQTISFEPLEAGEGTLVMLQLDYELGRTGVLGRITDVLFIRRALSDSLERTLRRFAAEAAEEGAL
jgi:uncharacterized membrane protein